MDTPILVWNRNQRSEVTWVCVDRARISLFPRSAQNIVEKVEHPENLFPVSFHSPYLDPDQNPKSDLPVMNTLPEAFQSKSPPGHLCSIRTQSGPVLVVGPHVAVEAGGRGEPPAAFGAAERRGGAGRRRRGRGRVCGAVCRGVSLPVRLQEGHPAEPPTTLLTLGPDPPPLLLRTRGHRVTDRNQRQVCCHHGNHSSF